METINKKYYALIGNDIYNLIKLEDEHLHGSIKTLSNKKFETTKIPKIESTGKQLTFTFFDRKRKNTRSIYYMNLVFWFIIAYYLQTKIYFIADDFLF